MSSNQTTEVAVCSTDRSDSINDTRTSDLKVTFNGTDYALHRVMVEAASKYFSSALSDFEESVSNHIIIDLDFASQEDFLFVIRWMYGAKVDVALDVNQFQRIYRLVCYLQIAEIRNLLLDLIKKIITTGRQILEFNITCRSLLNDISEHVSHQIEESDVCRLLRLSRETHSELLINVCHEVLAWGGCLSRNNISSFKEFTAEDVCVLFSAEEVPSLSSEDELLSLMQEVCIEASLTDDEQKEVARNVVFQKLSMEGISKAMRWDAVDNEELASCLAGEHTWEARQFGQRAPFGTVGVPFNVSVDYGRQLPQCNIGLRQLTHDHFNPRGRQIPPCNNMLVYHNPTFKTYLSTCHNAPQCLSDLWKTY